MNSRLGLLSAFPLPAVVVLLWFPHWQPKLAVAQVPGVGAGNLDANLPQPIGSPTATAPNAPPGRGEVFDPDALRQTKSFCVDLNHMESSQAADVKEFLAQESQPRKLLSRLPWQLVDDCTKADVVARIYFARVDVREEMSAPNLAGSPVSFRQSRQPVLLLYDKASIRLFYRAEGQVLGRKTVEVLRSPFAMLVKDLKKINRTEVKGS
jgi:hypothetical protein